MENNEKKNTWNKMGRVEMDNIEHSCDPISLTVMGLLQLPNNAITCFNLTSKGVDNEEKYEDKNF